MNGPLARCRLQNCQKLASQEEKRQQCWTWCGKLQPQKKPPSEAAEAGTEAAIKQQVEEEEVQAINVSFSVRGCGLIWNIESSPQQPPTASTASMASVIYQVYSQDSLEAWHDEGQSVQNWINLSPPTLGMAIWVVEFSNGGTKLERFFFPKDEHTQRKLLNFEFWINIMYEIGNSLRSN